MPVAILRTFEWLSRNWAPIAMLIAVATGTLSILNQAQTGLKQTTINQHAIGAQQLQIETEKLINRSQQRTLQQLGRSTNWLVENEHAKRMNQAPPTPPGPIILEEP